jgi:hypothetical protein
MTPWSPATLNTYDGWPVTSWRCGRNGWLDRIVEKINTTEGGGAFATVRKLADRKEKARAVSELAREVGLPEEKVASVIEKLGLTEIKRVHDDITANGLELYRWGRFGTVIF